MNKSVKKGVLSVTEKLVRMEVKRSENDKLPLCPLILHQPKRPKRK